MERCDKENLNTPRAIIEVGCVYLADPRIDQFLRKVQEEADVGPITQIMGGSNRIRPRYIVNSQLKTFAPVGIEMIIVVMPKNALTLAPAPIVKKWWSQVSQDTRAMTAVA